MEYPDASLMLIVVIGRPSSNMKGYGLERYTVDLCEGLSNHGVHAYFLGDWKLAAWLARKLPTYDSRISAVIYDIMLPFVFLLTRRCRRADVVHLADVAHIFPTVLLGRIVNPRMVVTVQSLNGITYGMKDPDHRLNDWLYSLHCILGLRLARHLVRKIIAVSSKVSDELTKFGVKSHVTVIHPCVRIYPSPKRDAPRNALTLGCVGAAVPGKRFERAIRLVQALEKAGVDCHLTICGAGRPIIGLRAYADTLGVSSSINFVGHIADAIGNYYQTFDFLVFPSRAESFGYPIVEAASYGVPASTFVDSELAPEVKALTLVAKDVKDAALIIRGLWNNHKPYLELSGKVARMADQFSVPQSIPRLVGLYREVASSL